MSLFARCSIIVFVLLVVSALLVSPSTRVDSMGFADCLVPTPTPDGTVPGPEPSARFYLSATNNLTFTTVFTIKNLENTDAQIRIQFLFVPGCEKSQVELFGTVPARKSSQYLVDNYFKEGFNGEVYIRSDQVVTGTSEISRRYAKFYLPAIRK